MMVINLLVDYDTEKKIAITIINRDDAEKLQAQLNPKERLFKLLKFYIYFLILKLFQFNLFSERMWKNCKLG